MPVPSAIGAGGGSRMPGPGPGGLRSAYRDPEDLRRAQLQTEYGRLSGAERAEQDVWATRKADEFAPCPYNYAWVRAAGYPGVSLLPPLSISLFAVSCIHSSWRLPGGGI